MCGGSTLNTQPKGTVVERELRGSCNSNFFFFLYFYFVNEGPRPPGHLISLSCYVGRGTQWGGEKWTLRDRFRIVPKAVAWWSLRVGSVVRSRCVDQKLSQSGLVTRV